jgi:hypothetical protein
MNLDTRARASARAIDRSATRLDPVVGLDDLLRRHRRQPLRRAAAAAAFALLGAAVAIWAGVALRGPTPIQPTLGPITRIRVGPAPVSVAVMPGAAWVLNAGRLHHLPARPAYRPGAGVVQRHRRRRSGVRDGR